MSFGIRNWAPFALAALVLGCGSSPAEDEAPKSNVPLGAPLAIGGGPLGSATPIPGIEPTARKYESPGGLIPPAQRKRPPEAGLSHVKGWLNTTRAFTGEELTGRILLIDFWTAGCINCIHVAETLETVARMHEDDPVLILGVHAQKFTADAPPEVVRQQMQDLGITHPVAIDSEHQVLDEWGVNGWPALFVIDAHGRIAKQLGGEPSAETLHSILESALHEQAAAGGLATGALDFLGRELDPDAPLASPAKIIAVPDGYAIADTGHNRIVITDAAGAVTDVIGDGNADSDDGSYASASFFGPKGMAQVGDVLYVADTTNHLLRAVNRQTKTVGTVAGTGERGGVLSAPASALGTALASPWDLLFVADKLYIANAGTHQVAVYDPAAGTVAGFAGTSKEGLEDGPAADCKMAQPSGLASDGKALYVADAESSSIRKIDLATQEVTTLVGKGLFSWGDFDGPAQSAKLQHVQGLALDGNTLYIADTYNSKIKALDLTTLVVTTVAGNGSPPPFFYPGGLTVASSGGPALLVADTDHDAIKWVELGGTKEPVTWDVTGLSAHR